MRQKKDLIIQLEIYSVVLNFIWFTQAKLKTVCPFRKDISLAKVTILVWAQSRQHAVSQISLNFLKLFFPHGCIYNSHDCLHM